MKVSSVLYGLAVLTLPVGSAVKLLFGSEHMLWIDPTLIFSAMAFVALAPAWNTQDSRELSGATIAAIVLTSACIVSAISGFLLRPVATPYDALREPARFFLTLIWLITSRWFLRFRPQFVFRCAAAAVIIGLLSGIYIDLAAGGFVPATQQIMFYSQEYVLRQIVWLFVAWVPRMGGLFLEAPPFGLFMLAMAIVFYVARRSGIGGFSTLAGLTISVLGTLASLADQALSGLFICALPILLYAKIRRGWLKSFLLIVFGGVLAAPVLQAVQSKLLNSSNIRHIYQTSVGERAFHLNYGLSLLEREPVATLFGIGPGRYGEYVAETGYFPDTVTMQFSEPEILVEWGVVGLGIWIVVLTCVAWRIWKLHGFTGVCFLLGLLNADSFQSNWKSEAVFFAIAALCTPALIAESDDAETLSGTQELSEAAAG